MLHNADSVQKKSHARNYLLQKVPIPHSKEKLNLQPTGEMRMRNEGSKPLHLFLFSIYLPLFLCRVLL